MLRTKRLHERFVLPRRISILAEHIAPRLETGARVLDVGAGAGLIAAALKARRPDVTITAIDVRHREQSAYPVALFDGERLPFADKSFDALLLIDVLHHTRMPRALLQEAARVAERVILKDHTRDGPFAYVRLAFMDYVGNSYARVPLPNNYLSRAQWESAFDDLHLREDERTTRIGLYPWPANVFFERGLHFVTTLSPDLSADRNRGVPE